MDIFIHVHSGLRWLLLIGLILAIWNAYSRSHNAFVSGDKRIHLLTLIFTHLQLIIGLILYFGNKRYEGFSQMDIPVSRFLALEHIFGMLIAIGLITIAYGKVKACIKQSKPGGKTWVWYLIALLIILISIPWPFRGSGFDYFGYF